MPSAICHALLCNTMPQLARGLRGFFRILQTLYAPTLRRSDTPAPRLSDSLLAAPPLCALRVSAVWRSIPYVTHLTYLTYLTFGCGSLRTSAVLSRRITHFLQ